MREDDLSAVIAIEGKIYEFPWTQGNFQDSLRAGYICWLCREKRELLGYAVLMNVEVEVHVLEVHLLNLSIAEPHQGLGHGRRMLLYLIDNARRAKAEKILLEVRPSNSGAIKLYTAFGFKQVGVRRDYYPAARGREDALVMALEL
ncbi:MAG: ribosomal-protein-alanine N-acetyltransferase [Betaproteobacteria bacterium]|nr:ribosomal-protein-alanine N-acetyltransferase [Betaproteobacteria bacterium]